MIDPSDQERAPGASSGVPPSDIPPIPPVTSGQEPDDPLGIVKLIRMVSGQQVDQLRAETEAGFARLQHAISEIVAGINQLALQMAAPGASPVEAGNRLAPQAFNPPAPPLNPRDAVASAILGILNDPNRLTDMVASLAQARNMWKPPTDIIAVLSQIKATHPELLNLYAPDAMGGRFPDLQAKAVGVGMDVMKSAMASAIKAQSGSAPLVAGPYASSANSPETATPQAQNPDSVRPIYSRNPRDLTDRQISDAVGELMAETISRRGRAA